MPTDRAVKLLESGGVSAAIQTAQLHPQAASLHASVIGLLSVASGSRPDQLALPAAGAAAEAAQRSGVAEAGALRRAAPCLWWRGVGALVKVDDADVINFLLSTEIIPLCLRIMETGSELSKTVATFIVRKTLKRISQSLPIRFVLRALRFLLSSYLMS